MKQTKTHGKLITVTAERLSDHSRITFTISSDKTIEQLRALLNHHLPPQTPNRFDLYSYQRGALIHFHPSSFKLDYFPVIFDQSVLLLQMDDININHVYSQKDKNSQAKIGKQKYSLLKNFLSSTTTAANTIKKPSSSSSSSIPTTESDVTCLTILKQIFQQPSKSINTNVHYRNNILTY